MTAVTRILLLLLALVPLGACGELPGLMTFQRQFAANFGLNAVDVRRSDAELVVVVGDERYRSVGERERAAAAREMAEYVRDRYEGYERLESVTIRFSHTRKLVVATSTREQIHGFSTAALGAPGDGTERNVEPAGAY